LRYDARNPWYNERMPRLLPPLVALTLGLLLTACAGPGRNAPDFTLHDDGGRTWTLSQQHGEVVLLTFGFTHCADTCPATLAKLEHLTAKLGDHSKQVEIAFVTVDPQRDTPAVMHRFLERFTQGEGGRLVGLTGTPSQIAGVERVYHVWSQRIPGRDTGGDYDVAHTAVIYVIDARGRIRSLNDDDASEQSLQAALQQVLG
jgi:protein SCO1